MKSLLFSLFTGVVVVSTMHAQDSGGGGNWAERAQQRLDNMKSSLSLTDDQVTKIKAIYEETRPAMQALRDDSSLSQDDRRAKMREIRDQINEKVGAVLTPEQKTKWEEQRRSRQGGGGQGGGSGDGHNPSSASGS